MNLEDILKKIVEQLPTSDAQGGDSSGGGLHGVLGLFSEALGSIDSGDLEHCDDDGDDNDNGGGDGGEGGEGGDGDGGEGGDGGDGGGGDGNNAVVTIEGIAKALRVIASVLDKNKKTEEAKVILQAAKTLESTLEEAGKKDVDVNQKELKATKEKVNAELEKEGKMVYDSMTKEQEEAEKQEAEAKKQEAEVKKQEAEAKKLETELTTKGVTQGIYFY